MASPASAAVRGVDGALAGRSPCNAAPTPSDWAQMEYLDREHLFSAVLSTATASHDAGRTKRSAAGLSDARRGLALTPEYMQPAAKGQPVPFTRMCMGSADFGGKSVEYVKAIYATPSCILQSRAAPWYVQYRRRGCTCLCSCSRWFADAGVPPCALVIARATKADAGA
jgi:hypothetical protein